MNSLQIDTNGFYGNIKYIFLTVSTGLYLNGQEFVPRNGGENRPVVNVTWEGATHFCRWMGGRLPTEWEWYWAADTTYKYSGSNSARTVAWFSANSNGHSYPVGLKAANDYELYDMSGNVAEWCHNWYDSTSKVYKGGHWNSKLYNLTLRRRFHHPPDRAGNYLGFRVAIPR